jgi:erythromycin esterase-like protein
VVAQLVELRRRAADYATRDGRVAEDDYFQAEQNARLVLDAEQYYRSMFQGRVSSWNLRDTHMADTLDALIAHHTRQGRSAKVVIWAHNSHVGDARATQMGREGELSTHTGTVTAATDWGAPAERKRVRPSVSSTGPTRSGSATIFEARLGAQFDAVLHYDVTRAVEPLERGSLWDDREPPETYPTGI